MGDSTDPRANHTETLLALSHAMHGAIAQQEYDALQALVEERGQIVRELYSLAQAEPIDEELAATLREAFQLGEQSYLPLVTRRETAREDLKLLRRRRQNQQALKPSVRTAGRLNVHG